MTLLTCVPHAAAAPISRGQAQEIAARYVSVAPAELRAKAQADASFGRYYIFNDKTQGNGFVIISGNDDCNPVLGYSDKGYISEETMPDGLRSWLSQAESLTGGKEARSGVATVVVAPLIKTQWYQLEPYNGKLAGERIFTGCVATAMSQIIKYHQWPAQPWGSGSYDSYERMAPGGSESVGNISYDISESHYDFGQMLDTYADGLWTPEQADAVATLMRDCGYAARMQYRTTVSSSYDEDMAIGMNEHFGYDTKIYPHFGDYSDTDLWMAALKKELDEGFPVIMTGQASMFGGEGHCFIADGYDSNGFLHINWGWNGDADGYYNIGILRPMHQESYMNFSYMQYFTSLRPIKEGSAPAHNPRMVMLWDIHKQSIDNSGLTVENPGEPLTGDKEAKVRVDGLCFIAYRPYKGEFLLRLEDSGNSKVKDVVSVPVDRPEMSKEAPDQLAGIYEVSIPASAFEGVADGEYTLVPMGRYGEMEAQKVQTYGYKSSLRVTVAGGVATIYNIPRPETKLRYVKPLELDSEIPLFSKIDTTIEIANEGDFIEGGRLIVEVYDAEGQMCARLHDANISLYAGRTTAIPLSLPILPSYAPNYKLEIEPGKSYTIKYRVEDDVNGEICISGEHPDQTFNATLDETMVPHIVVDEVKVTDSKGNEYELDNLVLNNDEDYNVAYTYHSEGKGALPYQTYIEYSIPEWNRSGKYAPASTLETELPLTLLMLEPGETVLKFRYKDFLTGEMIKAIPENLCDIPVKIVDPSAGVAGITSGGKPRERARYDVLGRKLSSPTEGINVVVYSDGSVRKEYVGAK